MIKLHKKQLFRYLLAKNVGISFLLVIAVSFVFAQKSATVILPGNFPDPSIVCVEDEYYLINSTNIDNPGIPVWHSVDLKKWSRIGYALNNKIGDVWAPDLVFYEGTWYIYFTALADGVGNYVITAQNPAGPWSQPVRLNVRGIDPGHIATPEGKRFLYMNGGIMVELDSSGTKVIGEPKHAYDPWPIPDDYVIECECAEGPKALYYNNYYYLILAQGGTSGPSTSHMAVALRSKNVDGPWEYSPYNPVIHTKDKDEHWWSTGHATLFKGGDGQWYMVFHAYENGYRNKGRSVLITPVDWTDVGWFKEAQSTAFTDVAGKDFSDEFDSNSLDFHWTFIDDSSNQRIAFADGKLWMNAKGDNSESSNPLVISPENHKYEVTAKVSLLDGATAGLELFYNNSLHWGIALSPKGIVEISRGRYAGVTELDNISTVYLRIINDRNDVSCYYSIDGDDWTKLECSYDISGFHTNTFGGYRSIRAGLFTAGKGKGVFDYFRYRALD